MTALVLALGVTSTTAATAAPTAPSWDDVQSAKGDVEATQIAVSRILESVAAMNAEAEQLRIASLIAGEQHQQATAALEQAVTDMATVERRRDAALERADASGQQAAQLAAQLARAGGGDLTMALIVSGSEADDLLYRLGTMSALSTRTDAVMTRALQDRNVAAALREQAVVARDAHRDATAEAEAVYAEAADVAAEAEQRALEQQALLDDLAAKLAELTGRSAALEREYLESLEHEVPAPPAPGNPAPGNPVPSPSAPAPSPSAPAPSPSAPAPSPSSPAPQPPAPSPSAPAPAPPASGPQPNAAAVATAIAFARAQLGEPYQYGAAGPNAWDCSGLTMMAYSAAGLAIGGHGATSQYSRAASRGLLVPYSQAQPGDLIFYSTGGSTSASKYHVTLYIGGGQMIEAPMPGRPVRIVTVRSYDLVGMVARPSG